MANYGLLSGLGGALEGFGKLGLKEWSDQQDEERDNKKMMLKNKLDMDLMKAKYEFMKENPRYKQFFTDLSGNRIGVDEMGNEKTVHQATPEEAADAKATREGKIAYTQALQSAALARAANAGATTDSTNDKNYALADLARGRTGHLGDPKKGKKDDSILTPAQWQALSFKFGGGDPTSDDMDDPEITAKGDKILKNMGYKKGFQNAGGGGASPAETNFGPFAGAPGLSGGGAGGGGGGSIDPDDDGDTSEEDPDTDE